MEFSDELCLPEDTLKILNEYLQEKEAQKLAEQERIQKKSDKDVQFEEDWQLSQFWYNQSTKETLGNVVRQLVAEQPSTAEYKIALLSCPSLYATVKEVNSNVNIFEYDGRFAAYGDDFVHYDFNEGNNHKYLKKYHQSYDLIIADPPFLSEECITKICKIIRNLSKSQSKLIFCSGEIVERWLLASLANMKKYNYRPEHERNLGNEFISYANFNLDKFINNN